MTSDDRFRLDQPPASAVDWRDAVDSVLKGKSFEKVLVGETRGGLDIQPLYEPASGVTLLPVDPHRVAYGWDIRQRHEATVPADSAAGVLDDLEHGVTSIELGPPGAPWTLDTLRKALDGVLLDIAPVALAPHADLDASKALVALIDERGNATTSRSWLGLDPVGAFARSGPLADVDACAAYAASIAESHPYLVACTVDTTRYVDAGADEVQELGWMLATGVAMLRAGERAGLSVERAAATIGFRVSADADQFLTIARLRAARTLWAAVLTASGASDATPSFHAVTSAAMFSERDAAVNMLRSTSAAFAAGVGGADAVTVLPFDGSDSALARRNARNIQHLLIDESGINRLIDPAAGSGFVESLTQRLVDAGWAAFQHVEAAGGMAAILESGAAADEVLASWNSRLGELATRREPLTGVSEFPDNALRAAGANVGDQGAFPMRRAAAPFEALRDAADRARSAGSDPIVHLATLGTLTDHTARSTWISNFLGVGGLMVDGGDSDGAASPVEAAARFDSTATTVAVICSSDAVYAERAVATVTALKDAGASFVALAGHPGELRADLEAAGVDAFFHVGVDVLSMLGELHQQLGLS